MKQHQYSPMTVAQMAVSLFIVEKGFLDDIPANEVTSFEAAIQDFMKNSKADLMHTINETGDYNAEIEKELKSAVEEFKRTGSW